MRKGSLPRWTPKTRSWAVAAGLGGLLLALGLALGRGSKPVQGEYSGFWSGVAEPQAAADPFVQGGPLACPTAKCLTVYLAPWCPHCRDAAPALMTMRDYLKKHGVRMNVVVGMDRPKALVAYAKAFGPDTLIDEQGALAAGGVPHFFVTDQTGHLLREQAGVPEGVTDPKEFAALFGLP